MITLNNWSVCSGESNPYTPPEQIALYLQGVVAGHPDYEDGDKIHTSRIVNVDGNIITTNSGTKYKLGEPDTAFVEFCKKHGHYVPTKEQPIKVR